MGTRPGRPACRNRSWAHNAGMGGFVRMPDSKCAWHDIGFEQINPQMPVLKDPQPMPGREPVTDAFGTHVPLPAVRLRVRPEPEHRPQQPGVHEGLFGRRRRGGPPDEPDHRRARSAKRQPNGSSHGEGLTALRAAENGHDRVKGQRQTQSILPAHRKSTSAPGRVHCRARVQESDFAASTGLCWTRTSVVPLLCHRP